MGIGNNVWLPHAWVNPGVTIGDNVVVTAMSLVNRNLPSGCLAGGIPVKILKENVYPNTDVDLDEIIRDIYKATINIIGYHPTGVTAYFDIKNRTIEGPGTEWSRVFKNQLRRNGIRFRYKEKNGEYVPW